MSIIERFKSGLNLTRLGTFGQLSQFFSRNKFDDETLDELENSLLEADLGVDAVDSVMDDLRSALRSGRIKDGEGTRSLIYQQLLSRLKVREDCNGYRFAKKPWVILLVGVNGSGKTTTAGKLAYQFGKEGRKTVIGAADTFRAAAVEQVEKWAERSGARLVKQGSAGDPAAVAYDSYQSIIARNEDVLIIDTAGRLQSKKNLMHELAKISRTLKKLDPAAPHESLLVIDATTGQNGLSQARAFTEFAGITGLILTKLDGTARGGIAIPISNELDIPIEFIGLGEGIEDLQPFQPELFVRALLE